MAFTIQETKLDTASIYIACHVNDEIWAPMTKDITPEDHLSWISTRLEGQQDWPQKKVFGVFENATGYVYLSFLPNRVLTDGRSKLVAYATLFIPWKFTEEEKAAEAAKPQLPLPAGMNQDLFKHFLTLMSSSTEYGYDPEKHFRGSPRLPSL